MAISLPIDFEFGTDLAVVGKPHRAYEGPSIVTGRYMFPYDYFPGKKLFAAILGCPHAHCKVKSINTSKAEELEGVKAVITMQENPQYKTDEVLVWGWEIAAVAATDPFIAERAVELIEVEYEELPFVLDPDEAWQPGSTLAGTFPDSNVQANPARNSRGDIEAGFEEAEVTIEVETPFLRPHTQNTIEPVTGVAWWEGEHVYGYDQGQNPHAQNRTYASQLGVNQSRCHIRQTSGVGGLGGGGQTCEPSLCALLSKKAGVPVAISRTRRLHSIRRRNHYSPKGITKLGGKRDGTMTAMQQKWYCHGGFNAAAGNGWENIDCSYILPNVTQETYGVATNTGFGAGHRCLMHPEAAFTLCVALNAMADAIGMTPLEYLRKVTITDDMLNQDNGRPMTCASTRMCLEAVNEKINYEQKYHAPGTRTLPDGRLHGVGIACFNDRHGHSGAGRGVVIYMNTDGTCNFVTGQSNNQNGTNSVTQANIIAEALGLPFEAVYCSSYGTNDQAPDGGMQAGSQGASSNGSASLMAALDIREQLFAHAANQLGVAVDDLHARDGKIFVKTDQSKSLTHAEVMARISKPIIGVGKSFAEVLRRPFQGKPIGTPAFHRQGVASAFEVAVDPDTGDVEILAHAHTTDCGRVIDPVTAGGQIGSSLWTACGKGLLWDVHHDPQRGALLDQTHIDMKAHTAMDINDDVHGGWLTESVNATGPFGMSGLGEPAANGSGFAALLMAIHNAIGGDFSKFTRPMSPDRILKHLGKA